MTNRKLALAVYLAITAVCVVHAVHYLPLLPDRVPSHFDISGKPDDWMDKGPLMTLYLGIVAGLGALFIGIGVGIGWVGPKIPKVLINLPNKAYWFDPERRDTTFETLSALFLWYGSATVLLMLDIFHQSFLVALGRAETLGHMFLSMGLYLGFTLVWIVLLYRSFGKPKAD